MADGSIASHQQYLLSMHVLLITAAGCPLHGPELFIHTNRHKYSAAHTHIYTQNTASEEKLAFCFLSPPPTLPSFLPLSVSFLLFCLSLVHFCSGQKRSRRTPPLSLSIPVCVSLSLSHFLTSRSPRCLLMDTCLAQHILLPGCCLFFYLSF